MLKLFLAATGVAASVVAFSQDRLDSVVVTGVSRAMRVRESPLAIAVVGGRQLDRSAENTALDALAGAVPGLAVVKTGPNVSKPFINGLGYNRVLTLYDGMRVETQQWGDEHGIPADDYSIGRAEVIKGPASLLYGSDAIAGVVSLFPVMPATADGVMHGRVLSEYQRNNGLVGNGFSLWRDTGGWSWVVRGSERVARNYTNPVDGRVYNTAFRVLNASGMVGYRSAAGYSRLNVTVYDNHQGIPDGSRDSLTRRFTRQVYESAGENVLVSSVDDIKSRPLVSQRDLDAYAVPALAQRIQDYRVYTDNQYRLGKGMVKAFAGWEQNIRREYDHPTDVSQAGEWLVLNTLNYSLRWNGAAIGGNGVTGGGIEPAVGVNGMYQGNSNRHATDFPIPDYRLFDLGGYVFGKWKRGPWVLSGGVRYDHRRVRGMEMDIAPDSSTGFFHMVNTGEAGGGGVAGGGVAGATQQFPDFRLNFRGWTGSIGVCYSLSDRWLIKANLSRGYRSPNITEIAANGLDPGAHIVYQGNLRFSPEFSLQEDLGVTGEFPDLSLELSGFNNFIHGYIYEDQEVDASGNPVVIVPGNKTFQFQQTNAQLYGGNLGVRLHPRGWPGFSFENVFSFVYGFNRKAMYAHSGSEGEYLPFIPPPRWLSTMEYAYKRVALSVAADMNAAQHRYLGLYGTETPTAGYVLLNTGVHADVCCGWQVQLQVNNLLDAAYQNHLSRLQYFEYYTASPNGRHGIYNMGRNVCVKVICSF